MIEFRNSEINQSLVGVISGDFLLKTAQLLKDNPGYLTEIVLRLDRVMDEPEDQRPDLVREIFSSIERDMPQNNNKIVVI